MGYEVWIDCTHCGFDDEFSFTEKEWHRHLNNGNDARDVVGFLCGGEIPIALGALEFLSHLAAAITVAGGAEKVRQELSGSDEEPTCKDCNKEWERGRDFGVNKT